MTAPNWHRLHTAIAGVEFPCDHSDLVRQAAAAGADDDVLGHLSALPRRRYTDSGAVVTACGELAPGDSS
ncbi:DUF2795 domain-containing protein [Prauserella cavernicola]|uniref:DUF2795 domain-containing protein n=1 Tax=Prauserella cavernicola TaxID=2800127 RepID=A0A934QSY3_9PSEU|nr:DUF2795 domain-containing protein [Prauserella cavernicola]MBK1787672.1 DUF2795 domain-containing protein [Prauserella cavernicola]